MIKDNELLKIDVGSIIKSKSSNLAKFTPNFVLRLLEKMIHQDDVNEILEKFGHLKGLEFVAASLKHLGITFKVEGLDNIKPGKRYIFASNHPLGGLDGLVLMDIFGSKFRDVKFVVNDLLMYIEPLKELFIPINKHGKQNHNNALLIDNAYKSDSQILYFPAGLCSRLQNGEIIDLEWKKSFINQAVKYDRDVVPVYFEGKNSNLFYRLANIRKSLGVKFNYEMLLLPRELFLQKNTTFGVFIGEPISRERLSAEERAGYWASQVREKVYSLKP